jgi:hypothetical protein
VLSWFQECKTGSTILIVTLLEAHQPVIPGGEERPGEVNHVYLDALHRELVGKGADKLVLIVQIIKRPKDQVDADNAKRLLPLRQDQ